MNQLRRAKKEYKQMQWYWHLLLLVAGILVLTTFLINDAFVERWFSADGHITDSGRHYLEVLKFELLMLAGGLLVIWILRRIIMNDWRTAVKQWKEGPSYLDTSAIVPSIDSIVYRRFLWLLLCFWIIGVAISFIPGYEVWAIKFTRERGLFETLTVVFYLYAGMVSLRLAIPFLKRNSPQGLTRWWLLGLLAGCFFIAGEEINWGQIYFNYDFIFADFIRRGNYQNDFSLHNVALPYIGGYWANDLSHVLAICGGVLLPLLIRFSVFFRRLMWVGGVLLPPWVSQAYFFVAAIIPPDNFIKSNMPSELREITIAFGVTIWVCCLLQHQQELHRIDKTKNS